MEEKNTTQNKKPHLKKPPIFWIAVVILGVMLISTLFSASRLIGGQTETVEYSTFIRMVDEGQVEKAQIGLDTIVFTLHSDEGMPKWYLGLTQTKIYQCVAVDDPLLVDRLLKAGVEFGGEDLSGSSLLSMILSLVLPLALYGVIIFFVFRMIKKSSGGMGAMSFGKSSAKMYTVSDESKKFTDVAGQDEAKEALIELVDFLHQMAV